MDGPDGGIEELDVLRAERRQPVAVAAIPRIEPAMCEVVKKLGIENRLGDLGHCAGEYLVRQPDPQGRRLAVTQSETPERELADAVGARLLMGINLEADSSAVASREEDAIASALGSRRVAALELGNEPELYGNHAFGWYIRRGTRITVRPRSYDMAEYIREFSRLGGGASGVPLAGPASGGSRWLAELGEFEAGEPRLGLVTVHRYPLQACYNTPGSPVYPTISTLLSPAASTGSAAGAMRYVTIAHSHHLALRIDEMNNISCGVPRGVPDTFAMALWVLDALFGDAQAGVDGVNIHTYPTAVYQLFRFTHLGTGWRAVVEPEYYGLLMFAKAAPPGSELVRTRGGTGTVRAWATRDRRGVVRVVLINDSVTRSRLVRLDVAGARGAATVERLQSTGPAATGGVTLGGQTYGRSTATGDLAGPRTTTAIAPGAGAYLVRMPPASAALLTLR